MTAISALQDTLTGGKLNTSLWSASNAGNLAWSSSGLAISSVPGTTTYSGIASLAAYDLTGGVVYVHLASAGSQSIASWQASLQLAKDASNGVQFIVGDGVLTAQKQVSGVYSTIGSATYDPEAMQWLRIRESGGVLYFAYSADGNSWHEPISGTSPFAVTALTVSLSCGTYASETSGTSALFLDVNVAPGSSFPQGPLGVAADLQLGGNWTAVTKYAYQREGTSPPLSITRGRPDESSQVNPASMTCEWNNRDGRFSVKNPTGPYYGLLTRNTPVRVSVPAQTSYLRLEADNTSYASCPNSAGLGITGDIDLRIEIRPTSYVPSTLAAKWDGGASWVWLLNNDGTQQWSWFDSSAVQHAVNSSLPIPPGHIALRVTMQVSTGTVTWWTAPAISGPWAQYGQAVVFGATSLLAAAAPLSIGYSADLAAAGSSGLQGSVYGFQLLNGIGGTVVAYANFAAQAPGAGAFADGYGNTWTLWNTAEISNRSYRFHGEASSLPVKWDTSGRDVWVPVAAGGLLRRLGQGNAPVYSTIKRALLAQSGTLAVVAYWPCEDLQGSTAIGSAIGGPLMTITGGTGDGSVTTTGPAFAADTSFLCSTALPEIKNSRWYGQVPAYVSSGSLIVRFLLKLGTPGQATLVRVITSGTCQEFSFWYENSTSIRMVGYGAGGSGTVFDTGTVNFGVDLPGGVVQGNPLWVSMELQPGSGSTVNYSLTVLPPGNSVGFDVNGSFTGTVGNATAVYVDPGGFFSDTVVGHISVQSAWQSLFDLASPLDAWQGELAANRFARLCAENGFQARIYGPPATTVAMGAQSAQTLTTLLQECEDADRGMIYEPRQALALGYRTQASLLNQAAAVTLDYSAAELAGSGGDNPVEPIYDDQFTRNDLTLQRGSGNVSGASYRYQLADGSAMSISPPPTGVGDYANSDTENLESDTQLPDAASWRVHVGTVDEARWPVIPVNLTRAAAASVFWAVLEALIGDRADVVNPPGQLPPDSIRQLIADSKEEFGGFFYQVTWAGVPESPYETGIYDDPVYGRADTDGSTLASNVTATAASLSVATTDTTKPLWTVSAADFPFDIKVSGERMTVTNITGSSSPQAFTVTRSVNGVVKSHSAGEDVRLWFPPVYAML